MFMECINSGNFIDKRIKDLTHSSVYWLIENFHIYTGKK